MAPHARPARRRLLAAVVACLAVATSCSVYAPSWSSIHADGSNTDYSPVTGARDLELAWQRSFTGSLTVGATVDPDGRVYLTGASPGCQLQALDPATGATVWCSGEVDRFAVVSSPLIDVTGRLFVGDGEAMHAFDREGNLLWETPIVGVPLSAQFTPNGRLIFITHVGTIYVLYRETGAHVLPPLELIPGATFDPADGIQACARGTADCPSANTLAVDLQSGRFFFTFWAPGAPQAGLRAMQVTGGPDPQLIPLWTNDSLPGGSASSPTLSADGSRLYVTDNGGALHAIDARTGADIWTEPIGYNAGGSPSLSPDGLVMPAGGGLTPTIAVQDEGDDATVAWTAPALLNRGIPTQVAGGVAYVTARSGLLTNDLVVVDTATGAVLDREPIPGNSLFSVGTTIGPDGTVYVPTILGDLFAFRPVAT